MIYRMDKQHEVLATHAGCNNKDVSVIIGKMWPAESEQVKNLYRRKAEKGRREHALKYPDYKYAPLKKRATPSTRTPKVTSEGNTSKGKKRVAKYVPARHNDDEESEEEEEMEQLSDSTDATMSFSPRVGRPPDFPTSSSLAPAATDLFTSFPPSFGIGSPLWHSDASDLDSHMQGSSSSIGFPESAADSFAGGHGSTMFKVESIDPAYNAPLPLDMGLDEEMDGSVVMDDSALGQQSLGMLEDYCCPSYGLSEDFLMLDDIRFQEEKAGNNNEGHL
ncbi:hypothetical protein HKX48_007067 [Thoreauomyces humboldtii]|nr:hypothetical protein HKX48_007067 [Thoreauomyces humboldtii]